MATSSKWMRFLAPVLILCLFLGFAAGFAGAAAPRKVYLPVVLRNVISCGRAPIQLEPPNGATVNTLLPRFRWDTGSNALATESVFQLSTSPAFAPADVVSWYLLYNPDRFAIWWVSDNLDPGRLYYWRVQLGCSGTPGPWSPVWTVTTGSGGTIPPALSPASPANGALVSPRSVKLSLNPVPGALSYQIEMERPDSRESWRMCDYVYPECTFGGLDPNSDYEWHGRAVNDYAKGPWSPKRTFHTTAQ